MHNKLYRTTSDRMLGGVCGGLAKYLQVDATLVRLFFVLLGLAGGGMIYVLMWIIVPAEGSWQEATVNDTVRAGSQEIGDRVRSMGDDVRAMATHPNPQAARLMGVVLVIVGVIYLLQNLHLPWLSWLDFDILWPVLLIAGGIALLRRHFLEKLDGPADPV